MKKLIDKFKELKERDPKKYKAYVACIVVSVITVILCIAIIAGSGNSGSESSGENSGDTNSSQNDGGSQDTNKEQVLYEDDNVKVTFINLYEEPSLPGNAFLQLKVENKSDKTVMVSLKDSYVNDTAQMMGTGVPIILASGKNSQQPFFFGYTNLGITNKDEIEKIEFRVWLMDNDTNGTVVETEALVVEFNK